MKWYSPVNRNQSIELLSSSGLKHLTVKHTFQTKLIDGSNLMLTQISFQASWYAFVKQQFHIL